MKKRWYLLLIAAGLLLCAVPLQFPSISPSPSLLCAGARVGPYWVGGSLGSLLCRVIRIRDPVLVQAYKNSSDERNTMICERRRPGPPGSCRARSCISARPMPAFWSCPCGSPGGWLGSASPGGFWNGASPSGTGTGCSKTGPRQATGVLLVCRSLAAALDVVADSPAA